jgi:hypothetical protein
MRRAWLGVWLAVALCGCPNPNTYTTPRTLDRGKVQFQVAPEFIGAIYKTNNGSTDANGNPIRTNASGSSPAFPTLGLRVGVADGFELGFRLPNGEPVAADAKIRLLKGRADVTLDPGFHAYYGSTNGTGFAVLYLHAPVLIGINFSQKVSLVLAPGLSFAAENSPSGIVPSGLDGASTASGFMGRFGLGLDFRISRRFSIHPEVTVMRQFTGPEDLLLFVGGVGFNLGSQPDYSDLGGGAEPPAETPAETPPETPAATHPPPAPAQPAQPPEIEVR